MSVFQDGFSLEDLKTPILEKHRKAMLDLILAWGSLDGALGMLYSRVRGVSMFAGAEEFGKMKGSAKLAQMIKLLKASENGYEAATFLRKHKKLYEKFSAPRNRIAHSHCAGYSKVDQSYVVFATFEKVGENELAVDAIPIEEMERATTWARSFVKLVLNVVDLYEAKSS